MLFPTVSTEEMNSFSFTIYLKVVIGYRRFFKKGHEKVPFPAEVRIRKCLKSILLFYKTFENSLQAVKNLRYVFHITEVF